MSAHDPTGGGEFALTWPLPERTELTDRLINDPDAWAVFLAGYEAGITQGRAAAAAEAVADLKAAGAALRASEMWPPGPSHAERERCWRTHRSTDEILGRRAMRGVA